MCAVVPEAPDGRARDRNARVIGVLVSGTGTNLQALLDAGLPVVAVASNRRDAAALDARTRRRRPRRSSSPPTPTARSATPRWPTGSRPRRPPRRARRLHAPADAARSSTASRAPSSTCTRRCCPQFPGAHAVEEQLAAGVAESGATVHLVDEGVDSGPILAQERVAVSRRRHAETLHARIKEIEHRLLPASWGAVRALISTYDKTGSRRLRTRPRRARLAARRERRHRRVPRGARPHGRARRGADRLPRDARRPREDAASAHPRRGSSRAATTRRTSRHSRSTASSRSTSSASTSIPSRRSPRRRASPRRKRSR